MRRNRTEQPTNNNHQTPKMPKRIDVALTRAKIHYVRDESGFPLATIASRPMSSKRDENGLNVAISIWNRNDPFNKKLGRQVAEGRLLALESGKSSPFAFEVRLQQGQSPFEGVMKSVLALRRDHPSDESFENGPPLIPNRITTHIKRALETYEFFNRQDAEEEIPDEIA